MATGHRTHPSARKTPDAFTRFVHAVLALAFLGAWLSAEWDGLRAWHIAFGHVVAGALLLRIAWSLARPQASLRRWWRALVRGVRRLRSQNAGKSAGEARDAPLRPATCSAMGLAAVTCGILVLVPGCFVSGWLLSRLVDAPAAAMVLHRWLGTALMVVVATHVALIAVLGVLRGRCMACDMLPGRGDRPGVHRAPAASGKGRG
jgi:cytochrome b